MRDKGKPEFGRQYALTGGPGDNCISNGNTWAESDVSGNEASVLERDGSEVFRGTHNQCLEWLQRHTPFSWDYAMRHAGYSIKKS